MVLYLLIMLNYYYKFFLMEMNRYLYNPGERLALLFYANDEIFLLR